MLKAGETGYAQLRCQADVVTHRDERFILRSVSPAHTMGGGRILVVNAERHQRFDDAMLERLERTAATDSQAVFEARLADAGVAGLKNDAIQQELGLPVHYIGIGEAMYDLVFFNPAAFVDSLFAEDDEE